MRLDKNQQVLLALVKAGLWNDEAQLSLPLEVDFKKRDGFLLSLKRSAELGLYRQSYCGKIGDF